MSIIEIGSYVILIVISEVELIVIIEEEPNIHRDSNCDHNEV